MFKKKIQIGFVVLLLLNSTALFGLRECLQGLQPESLWFHFDKICDIPRASNNERAIGNYIWDNAASLGLEVDRQEVGNVIVKKPATRGYENAPTVVLQSHLDMVPKKCSIVKHDFDTDALNIERIGDDYITACGSTLGADTAIGIASMLTIMHDKSLVHGPLEFLFTARGETDFGGAREITHQTFRGRLCLNLNLNQHGEIYIGSAGFSEVIGKLRLQLECLNEFEDDWENYVSYKVTLSGLKSSHFGVHFHLSRLNVAKYLSQLISKMDYDIFLASLSYKEKESVSEVTFTFPKDRIEKFEKTMLQAREELYAYSQSDDCVEPDIKLVWQETKWHESVLTDELKKQLTDLLSELPHGVEAWDPNIENLVQTSGNLREIYIAPATSEDIARIIIIMSQRSSIDKERDALAQRIVNIFKANGAKIDIGRKFSGWPPCVNSPLLNVAKETYRALFEQDVEIKAVHSKLECGEIVGRIPNMHCISFGPTIRDIHTTDEWLQISTVEPFWNYLTTILSSLSTNNI